MKRLLGFPTLALVLIVSVPAIAATKTVTLSVPGMNCQRRLKSDPPCGGIVG